MRRRLLLIGPFSEPGASRKLRRYLVTEHLAELWLEQRWRLFSIGGQVDSSQVHQRSRCRRVRLARIRAGNPAQSGPQQRVGWRMRERRRATRGDHKRIRSCTGAAVDVSDPNERKAYVDRAL